MASGWSIVTTRPYSFRLPAGSTRADTGSRLNIECVNKIVPYASGCDAMLQALSAGEVKRGGRVLLPALICTSVVRALQAGGYEVVFYDLCLDFSVDVDYVTKIQRNMQCDALVLVYYFGFLCNGQDKIKNLRDLGLFLIDDFCHSMMSGLYAFEREVKGDCAIFSMRKYLPVSDGGGLLFCSGQPSERAIGVLDASSKRKFSWSSKKNLLLFCLTKIFRLNIYSTRFGNVFRFVRNFFSLGIGVQKLPDAVVMPDICPQSKLLRQILSDVSSLESSALATQKTYRLLLQLLPRDWLEPVMDVNEDSVVPQAFPVKHAQVSELCEALRNMGIGAIRWPGLEAPVEVLDKPAVYPVATALMETTALLPCHYGMSDDDVRRMVSACEQLSATQNNFESP